MERKKFILNAIQIQAYYAAMQHKDAAPQKMPSSP
jgi:hypothetical protein